RTVTSCAKPLAAPRTTTSVSCGNVSFAMAPPLVLMVAGRGANGRGDRSGREGVAAIDRVADQPARGLGVERRLLDRGHLRGEVGVLDLARDPARVVAAAQVVQPGVLVDPQAELAERDQVRGAQVEPPLGA